jgi:hypothetical protein
MELGRIDVVGTTPLPGLGTPLANVPANVQVFGARGIERQRPITLPDFLERNAAATSINSAQGNPFQPDVLYRGFVASPLLGLPQGLSVFQDGVRINEPFGEIVNWDLIPQSAIASVQLVPGSGALFGPNTLGGALAIYTKSGSQFPGGALQAYGGSFGRAAMEVEHGGSAGSWDWFATAHALHDEGWAEHNPSRLGQFFGKVGYQTDASDLDVSVTLADNTLSGVQALPRSFADIRPALHLSRYQHQSPADVVGEGQRVPFRRLAPRRHRLPARLPQRQRGEQRQRRLRHRSRRARGDQRSLHGGPVERRRRPAAHACAACRGTRPPAHRGCERGFGRSAVHALRAARALRARPRHDRVRRLCARHRCRHPHRPLRRLRERAIRAERAVGRDRVAAPQRDPPSHRRPQRPEPGAHRPAPLGSHQPRGGRDVPSVARAHRVRRVHAEHSHAHGDRAHVRRPGCPVPPAERVPHRPFALARGRAYVRDGARGKLGAEGSWSLAAYRTELADDIQFVSSGGGANAGYFRNVGRTRREGLEAAFADRWGGLSLDARASWIRATFQAPFTASSRANSSADANGDIAVAPGDRFPASRGGRSRCAASTSGARAPWARCCWRTATRTPAATRTIATPRGACLDTRS